jgi:hypothetical protein
LTRSAVNAVAQGAAGSVAGLPESVGIAHQANLRQLQKQYDEIDAGRIPKTGGSPAIMARVSNYFNSDHDTRKGLRAEIDSTVFPVEQEPTYRAGQAIRDTTAGVFPINPKHAESLSVQIGQGIGSTAGFLASGLAGRVLRLPGAAVTAGAGASVNSAETFRDAMRHGATFEDAFKASKFSAVTGLTEALPIARVLDRYDRATNGSLRRIIAEGIKGGIEEGSQELFQSVADNLVASKIVEYDPERGIFTGTGDNAGVGFTVGALFNTLAAMVGARTRGGTPGQTGTTGQADAAPQVETPAPQTETPAPQGTAAEQAQSLDSIKSRLAAGPRAGDAQATVQPVAETVSADAAAQGQPAQMGAVAPSAAGLPVAAQPQPQPEPLPSARQPMQAATEPASETPALQLGAATSAPQGPSTPTSATPALDSIRARLPADRPTAGAVQSTNAPLPQGQLSPITTPDAATASTALRPAQPIPQTTGLPAGVQIEQDTLPDVSQSRGAGPVAGANYIGRVNAPITGEIASARNPKRREDILRPLLKDLGIPIYRGRVKGVGTLGFYKRGVGETRIKNMSDMETASHEIAHALDERFQEIRQQWLPASNATKAVRAELAGISYDKSKIFEGFAEFVRLWSTQKNEAVARAPVFATWFENFLDTNPHGPALRAAQTGMHSWFAQDALTRARSKIGAAKSINEGLTDNWRGRFRQSVADDLHGIMEMERSLTGGISAGGTYETARLSRSKSAIVEGALLYGAPVVRPDGSHGFEGKGLQEILKPVSDRLDDFLSYAVGRSARELKMQGREHLFTQPEIQAMTNLETPAFATAFDEYQAWNTAIVDFAQAKGVIDPAARKLWRRTQYLPFHRVGQATVTKAVPGDWKGVNALTGGTGNLRDILGNMIGNASRLIDAALTNEARLEVADLAAKAQGARFMVRIPTDSRVAKVHAEEIERSVLNALGVKNVAALDDTQQKFIKEMRDGMGGLVPLLQHGQSPSGKNVVAVLRKGKAEYYEVADPLLVRSLNSLSRPAKNQLVKWLSVPKRIGQLSITLSLDFLAANVARDTLMGTVMSRHGFRLGVDSAKGLKSRLTTDQSYKDAIANGVGFSSYFSDEDTFRKHIERFYTRKGVNYKTVLDSPAKLVYAIERIADAFEMSTRLGEYQRAIARGEHPRHAAYSAREVSTDFAMRGDNELLGFLYDTAIFFKASVNGADRLYRGLAHDPNNMRIAAKIAVLMSASAGLYLYNRGNPDYEDLEDWDKDAHWHIFVPVPGGKPMHLRYPKIWEIGAMASLAERTVETLMADAPAGEKGEKFAFDLFRLFTGVMMVNPIPQFARPAIEVWANRNFFTGRPIETEAQQSLQPFARSAPGGSRVLRSLGEVMHNLPTPLQLSPAQTEALVRGYLNSWGAGGLTLIDGVFFDDAVGMTVDQYPGIRRFYQGRGPSRHSRHVTEFYEALKAATAARRTMRDQDRRSRPDIADDIENQQANREYNSLSGADKIMRAVAAEMKQVSYAPTLPELQAYAGKLVREKRLQERLVEIRRSKSWNDLGALKRDLLDLWIFERNRVAKAVMEEVGAGRKAERDSQVPVRSRLPGGAPIQ